MLTSLTRSMNLCQYHENQSKGCEYYGTYNVNDSSQYNCSIEGRGTYLATVTRYDTEGGTAA